MWWIWRVMSVLGGLIALTGVVALVWLQIDANVPTSFETFYRWQIAMTPLTVVALGLIAAGVGYFLERYFDVGDDDVVVDDAVEPAGL